MLHPFVFARCNPDKPAVIIAETGETLTYRNLEESANQTAHLLRSLGLTAGDGVVVMLGNETAMFEIYCACDRAGLYFTPISTKLTAEEARYILQDSGAKAFFSSADIEGTANLRAGDLPSIEMFMTGEPLDGWRSWRQEKAAMPVLPIDDERAGALMLYSSGTTGKPKGVKRPLPPGNLLTQPFIANLYEEGYGANSESVYLSPAPLYHAAPLGWSQMTHRLGGTVIQMRKFDAEEVLAAIERHRVTLAQFVPTHMIRILRLPEEVKKRYDLSSLKVIFHSAAPCPVEVKQAFIDWLGPIVHEYYSGSEQIGFTTISSEEWLEHRGSVGRPLGSPVRVCDDDGNLLQARQPGLIYFEGAVTFDYHNDPAKTAEATNRHGWQTLGDVGWVDEDGYLYRKSFMIISGGVNIYPQEIENLLSVHPKVHDVAIIGAPDSEMGEKVVAVIKPTEAAGPLEQVAEELRSHCRKHLSAVKVPRQFDFVSELPRHPNGKLFKRELRDQYWQGHER